MVWGVLSSVGMGLRSGSRTERVGHVNLTFQHSMLRGVRRLVRHFGKGGIQEVHHHEAHLTWYWQTGGRKIPFNICPR